MASSPTSATGLANQRAEVMQEIIEVLRSELAIVTQHRWEELPDLNRRKVVLASKLRALSSLVRETRQPDDLPIVQMEEQSSLQIKNQLDIIDRQIFAFQELRQYWVECLSVSFRKYLPEAIAEVEETRSQP